MKKNKNGQAFKLGLFALPDHHWLPADWKADIKPETIILESGKSILVRNDCASVPGYKSKSTFDVAFDARQMLDTLFERAERGDEAAANYFAEALRNATSNLSRLCKSNPRLFGKVAARSWGWPVIMSTHPNLCDDHKTMLRTLELGKDTPLELHQSARWIRDEASEIAFGLLSRLWQMWREIKSTGTTPRKLDRLINQLDPFSDDSAAQWWEIAKAYFLLSYPEPQKIPELTAIVTAKSKRRSPGRLKQAILDLLRDRFISFAPPPVAYQT
jgi:hypothetical protein